MQKSILVVRRKSCPYRMLRAGSTLYRTHPPEITSLGIALALSRLLDQNRQGRYYSIRETQDKRRFKTTPNSNIHV